MVFGKLYHYPAHSAVDTCFVLFLKNKRALETMIGRGLPQPAALKVANCHSQALGLWRMTTFLSRYNPPVFSQRVRDILSLAALARSDKLGAEHVDVVGLQGAGHWVVAARAIAGAAIDRAAIDTAGFRFANLTAIDDPDFLPGGARYDDLPGMIALFCACPLFLAGESDSAISLISAAYRAAGQADHLTASQTKDNGSESIVVEWLPKDAL